jgi:hypothetical protein
MKILWKGSALALASALFVACESSGTVGEAKAGEVTNESLAPAPVPWPVAFTRASLLVADDVVIEGPKGLLDHVALRQDPANLDYSADTMPEGFLQVLKRKDPRGYIEIRGGVDNWEIIALDSIHVLERPGDVEVRIVATGGVWWRNTDGRGPLSGGEELRAEKLVFRGIN